MTLKVKIRTLILLGLLCCCSLFARTSKRVQLFEAAISHDVPPEAFVYNWRDAVLLKSFVEIGRSDPSRLAQIDDYVFSVMERVAPKAHGVHPNGIASAFGFAYLKGAGMATPSTDAALDRVLGQYHAIRRTPEGGCSHRTTGTELWDDTLYMLEIFLLENYRASGDVRYLDECVKEVLAHAVHLRDSGTGLWYHAWAESAVATGDACSQTGWNVNHLQRNSEFWGRGNGWVAMTLADLLSVLPKDHPEYPVIEDMYRSMMGSILNLQDRKTGLWYQLPARAGETGNFLEASCTAMFGYAMAKGFHSGLLQRKYWRSSKRALRGLDRYCLKNAGTEDIVLEWVCEGTCVGDRDYYFARRRIGGETYATGAYLLLANEIFNN